MNRPCNKALQCDDPDDPFIGFRSITATPVRALCKGVTCPGVDFGNLSTECADVDYLADQFQCFCQGDNVDVFFRAPGIGPFTWTVSPLPFGVFALHPPTCPEILQLAGTQLTGGRFFVDVAVTDGFGNITRAQLQWNVLSILTPTIPTPSIGIPYMFTLQASGGSGHYAWKIVGGGLSPGLNLEANGLISGTPTASQPAMVQFKVIDTECEQPDLTFLQPFAQLTGSSTTITATILGFPEFMASSPPKAYKSLDWSGGSQNIHFNLKNINLSSTTTLSYCGTSQIDTAGDQVTARQDQGVVQTNTSTGFFTLTGPCLFGNYIASAVFVDTYNVSSASFSNGPNAAARDMVHGLTGEAGYSNIINSTQAEAIKNAVLGTTIYNIARTVNLANEYTDAEALANSQMTMGTGLVASSFPRTFGYVSQWTACNFMLNLRNLQPGQTYVASVTLLHSTGLIEVRNYSVTASASDMSLPDSIPVPPDGEWTMVLLPTVAFAP